MARRLLVGAAALLLGVMTNAPAQAQPWQGELHRLNHLCAEGYRPACIRFGMIIGTHQEQIREWHREHPDWWWWEDWIER